MMEYADTRLNGVDPGPAARAVLAALEGAGLEAWIVGGWVRDALMGGAPHDVDLCCSGSWQESEAALRDRGIGVVESGVKFGGITAVCDGERIEVTTYRVDGFYSDGRHPEEVRRAATVEEDLARRDFTVNAMAWHPVRGLLDLYDGGGDIARRVIRAVGEPRRRFEEDALRMLRAVRFACRLGFEIEAETAAALAACAPMLDAVARERVGVELTGILATGRAGWALERCPEVMCAAIPELTACRGFDQRSEYHDSDVYGHIARVAEAVERAGKGQAGPSLRWAALLHDVAKPECFTVDDEGRGHFYGHPERGARVAREILRRLAIPDHVAREACLLIKYHDAPLEPARMSLLKMAGNFSREGMDASRLMHSLFALMRADALGKAPACRSYIGEIDELEREFDRLMDEGAAYSVKTLAVKGGDLIAAGVEPGRGVGEMLNRALAAQVAGKVSNSRADLLSYLGL